MKIIKNNLIPILLTIAVSTGLFFILSYISYDIHTYKPEPVSFNNMIKGRIEPNEFVANVDTATLDEFYQAPTLKNKQPELPLELLKVDEIKIYNWLELREPLEK